MEYYSLLKYDKFNVKSGIARKYIAFNVSLLVKYILHGLHADLTLKGQGI
jgi:hypothetical protein